MTVSVIVLTEKNVIVSIKKRQIITIYPITVRRAPTVLASVNETSTKRLYEKASQARAKREPPPVPAGRSMKEVFLLV